MRLQWATARHRTCEALLTARQLCWRPKTCSGAYSAAVHHTGSSGTERPKYRQLIYSDSAQTLADARPTPPTPMGTPDVPSTLLPRSFQASRESSHTHMVLSPMEQGGCAVQLAGGAQQPSHRTAGMPPSCRVHLDGTQGQGQPVGACPRCPGSASNSQQDPGTPPLNAGHSSCAAGAGGHHHGSTHGKPRGVSTGSLGQGPACSCRSISLQRPGTDRTQGTSPAGGGCHGGSTDTRRRRLLPFRRQRASLLLLSCTLAHMAVAVAAVRQGGIHVRSLGGAEEATTGAAAECVPPMEMEPSAQFHLGCQRYRKVRHPRQLMHRTCMVSRLHHPAAPAPTREVICNAARG